MIEQIKKRERYKELASSIVCGYYGIDIGQPTRIREYVIARAMYYKILRANTNMSFQEIAKIFNKHHATVIHSIKQLEGIMEEDYSLRSDFLVINTKFTEAIEDIYSENLDELLTVKEESEEYYMLLSDFNDLNQRHRALRIAHKELIESNEKLNGRYKRLCDKYDERESYFYKNGYIIR
jgi:DNA-binding Lrp family transcriptional regulator